MNDSEQKPSSGKRTLVLILVISIAPIALAYFSFFTGIGVPSSTASYGNIINPAISTENVFIAENSEFYSDLLENKIWHLLIPVGETCDEQCQKNIFITRQVHIRLGEKGSRVERVFVYLGDTPLDKKMAELKTEHPRLKGVAVEKDKWVNWLANGVSEADPDKMPYYILVDQEGFAMMHYTSEVDGGDLIKDLKRALKHSIDFQ